MSSSGNLRLSRVSNFERSGAARLNRCSSVVARASPADGNTWGKQRDPIEDAKQFVYSSTKKVKSRITQSADELGTKAAEAARQVDRKYNVRVKFRHAQTDFQRMLPHWKRRFRQFSASRVGKAALWTVFLWSIVSGTLFRVMHIFFLLWWILPLIVIPFVRRNAAKAQQNMYGAAGPTGARGFGSPAGFAEQRRRRPDPQDGQVIDVEWTTIDPDSDRGKSRR
eukprot:jgi/Ulvmu1/4322/UM002_0045.1